MQEIDKFCVGIMIVGIGVFVIEVVLQSIPGIWNSLTRPETPEERQRRLDREWQRREQQRIANENCAREQAERQRQYQEQQRSRELEQRRRKEQQEREAAWNEAERFYEAHKAILSETLPPAFFRSHIRSRMPEGIPPADAWIAARDIIAELTPLVQEARERQREKERQKQSRLERQRAIDKEIAACNAAITRLRGSRMEPDVIADEILGQQLKIRELREQKDLIANFTE